MADDPLVGQLTEVIHAAGDGSPPDLRRTPEAAVEILARELYVVGHPFGPDRIARERWYAAPEKARDGWRDDARRLLGSLRESDLALAWITDAAPDGPRTWAIPDEPGPEVTTLRTRDGWDFNRKSDGWHPAPEASIPDHGLWPWEVMVVELGPLTDVTPADPQDAP